MMEKQKTTYAQWAGILCNDERFRLWLDRRRCAKFNMDIPDGTHTVEDAREFILRVCEIQSRKELNTSPEAANRFGMVVNHYRKWLRQAKEQVNE